MRMSRLTVLALAILPALPSARAQSPQPAAAGRRPPITAVALRASVRGIQLTESQRTAIKSIASQQQPQLAAVRDSMKPWVGALKTARQQRDTAAAKAARVALRRGRLGVAVITRNSLADVRGTLTAEQQTQFDVNAKRVKTMLRRFVRTGLRPG